MDSQHNTRSMDSMDSIHSIAIKYIYLLQYIYILQAGMIRVYPYRFNGIHFSNLYIHQSNDSMQALCCCFKSSRANSTTCLNRVCLQKMHFILLSVKELQLKSFFIWVLHEFRETSCEVSPTLQSRNFMLT